MIFLRSWTKYFAYIASLYEQRVDRDIEYRTSIFTNSARRIKTENYHGKEKLNSEPTSRYSCINPLNGLTVNQDTPQPVSSSMPCTPALFSWWTKLLAHICSCWSKYMNQGLWGTISSFRDMDLLFRPLWHFLESILHLLLLSRDVYSSISRYHKMVKRRSKLRVLFKRSFLEAPGICPQEWLDKIYRYWRPTLHWGSICRLLTMMENIL